MNDEEQDYAEALKDPLANIIRKALMAQDARSWSGGSGNVGRLALDTAAKVSALLADGTTPTEPASVVGGGAELIAAERLRQVTGEGWTPEHDAEHTDGSMVRAAVCYASYGQKASAPYPLWPWADSWWKPSDDPIKNLVRAGALIAAEIDRINGTTPTEPAETPNAPAWVHSVLPSEIVRQRQIGWRDFHPEDFCHICGRRNPVWFAPAVDWDAVVDGHGGIFCPSCFTGLYAAATGNDRAVWEFRTFTPSVPAANGLESGEIVAVPADLRNDPNGVQWECYFAGYWLPVQADDTARRICRPITKEGQS